MAVHKKLIGIVKISIIRAMLGVISSLGIAWVGLGLMTATGYSDEDGLQSALMLQGHMPKVNNIGDNLRISQLSVDSPADDKDVQGEANSNLVLPSDRLPVEREDELYTQLPRARLLKPKNTRIFYISLGTLQESIRANDSLFILTPDEKGIIAEAIFTKRHKKKPVGMIKLTEKPTKNQFTMLKQKDISVVRKKDVLPFIELFSAGPFDIKPILLQRKKDQSQLSSGVPFTLGWKLIKSRYIAVHNSVVDLKKNDVIYVLTETEEGIRFKGRVRSLKKGNEIAIFSLEVSGDRLKKANLLTLKKKLPIVSESALLKRYSQHNQGPLFIDLKRSQIDGKDEEKSKNEQDNSDEGQAKNVADEGAMGRDASEEKARENTDRVSEKSSTTNSRENRYFFLIDQRQSRKDSISFVAGSDFTVKRQETSVSLQAYLPPYLGAFGDFGLGVNKVLTSKKNYQFQRSDEFGGNQEVSLKSGSLSAYMLYRYNLSLGFPTYLGLKLMPINNQNDQVEISESGIDPGGIYALTYTIPGFSLWLKSLLFDQFPLSFEIGSGVNGKLQIKDEDTNTEASGLISAFFGKFQGGYQTPSFFKILRAHLLADVTLTQRSISGDDLGYTPKSFSNLNVLYGVEFGLIITH